MMISSNTFNIFTVVLSICLLAVLIQLLIQSDDKGIIISRSEKLEKCLIAKGLDPYSITLRDRASDKAEYDMLNFQWNKYTGVKMPFAYIVPEKVEEVQSTIQCTRSLGIRVVARSGGHSAMKYSFGDSDSVVVDFRKQSYVLRNSASRTVDVGSGVRAGSKLLLSDGYFLPPGLCETVGISFALGGGYTNFARLYGYVVDSILELDMVDYNGSLITANSTSNSDLFWALRGGGTGGSFGFVTRYKFKLHPIPQHIIFGRILYPVHMFPEVFDAYQKFSISNSDRRFYLGLLIGKSGIRLELVQVVLENEDPTEASVQQALVSFFPTSNSTIISTMSLPEFRPASLTFLDTKLPGDATRLTDNPPMHLKEKSFFVKKIIGSSEIAEINDVMQKSAPFLNSLWQLHGGAIDDIQPDETAFVHRKGTLYKVNLFCGTPENRKQADEDEAREWMRKFYDVTKRSFGHTTSYQNIPDDEMDDYLERYYAGNLRRLQEVKTKYDPENYFQYPQSIPPL